MIIGAFVCNRKVNQSLLYSITVCVENLLGQTLILIPEYQNEFFKVNHQLSHATIFTYIWFDRLYNKQDTKLAMFVNCFHSIRLLGFS